MENVLFGTRSCTHVRDRNHFCQNGDLGLLIRIKIRRGRLSRTATCQGASGIDFRRENKNGRGA